MDLVENFVNNNNVTGKDTLEILEAHRKCFRWSKEERVLDIGCGPGDATANVILPSLPEGSVLVGCDISDGMLETCKRHVVNGRLTFKKLDIQQKWLNNGWENESFTKIFSFYCLHWVTDHRQAMQNVYTLLKPEGEILLVFLTPQNPIYNAFEILKQSPKWNGFMKDIEWFCTTADTTSFYTDLLKSIGFEDIQCYLKTTKHRIPSWTAYIELVKSINPFLRHIPAEMKSEMIGELDDVLKQQDYLGFEEDGGIIVDCNLFVVTAKKNKSNN